MTSLAGCVRVVVQSQKRQGNSMDGANQASGARKDEPFIRKHLDPKKK
jgi:hypothetical protein